MHMTIDLLMDVDSRRPACASRLSLSRVRDAAHKRSISIRKNDLRSKSSSSSICEEEAHMHMHMHMRMCVDCVRPSTEDLCTVGVTVRRALQTSPHSSG